MLFALLWLTYANQQVVKKYYDKYDRLIKISDVTGTEQVLAKFIYSDEEVATDVLDPTDDRLVISGSSRLRVVIDTTANTRTVYLYDEFGRLNQVHSKDIDTTQTNINTTQTKDEHDRVESVSQALSSGNAVTTAYTHATFPDNTLLAETTQLTGTTALSTTYSIDNLQRPTTTKVMCGNNGHKYTYSYIPRQTKTWVPIGGGGLGPIIRPGSVDDNVASPYALNGRWQIDDIGTTPYVSKFEEYTMSGNTATLVRTDSIVYDANGNIIQYGNVTYKYDGLNRLVRENNPGIDKTIVWCYDVGGNITSHTEYAYTTGDLSGVTPTNTFTYTYDTNWKDQLKSFNGQAIEYDQAGNPTIYRGKSLGWTRGRLLATYGATGSNYVTTMKYDADGIRREKVVPSSVETTTTTYFYNGNNLVQEKIVRKVSVQSHTYYKTYLYNSQGIIGFVQNGTTYTYRKNMFGDIVAIYQGATKVAEYVYDAWGNCTIKLDTNGIGTSNPFRYRSYYYDTDLGLYYLMSRYYDPVTGRFINADSLEYLDPETIGGINLYAYCLNNPVMHIDPTGYSWDWGKIGEGIGLIIAGVGAIVAGIIALPYGGWISVVAGITILAGGGTALFGLSDVGEGITDYNVIQEAIFMGDEYAYDVTKGIFATTAAIGSWICGNYIKYNTTTTPRSLPGKGQKPHSGVWNINDKTLGYYGSDGKLRYSISFNNHNTPNVHRIPHWHTEMPHSEPINSFWKFIIELIKKGF